MTQTTKNTLHSYRVRLVPHNTPAEDVAKLASAGMLRCERLRAADASQAARNAFVVFGGLPIHSVERIEEVEA